MEKRQNAKTSSIEVIQISFKLKKFLVPQMVCFYLTHNF